MLTTLFISGIKALIGITIILTGWLLVQSAWRKMFLVDPETNDAPERLSCHGCSCHSPCQGANRKTEQAGE